MPVSDDGVGMPTESKTLNVGLGTSIVQALPNQLSATLVTADEHPGTRVTINHTQIALVAQIAASAAFGLQANRSAGKPTAWRHPPSSDCKGSRNTMPPAAL